MTSLPIATISVFETEDLDYDARWEDDLGNPIECSAGRLVIRTTESSPILLDITGSPQGGPDHWVRFHANQATVAAVPYTGGPVVYEIVLTRLSDGAIKSLGVADGTWSVGVAHDD